MLDIKKLRSDMENIKKMLEHRGGSLAEVTQFTEQDEKRRALLQETEQLKNKRNIVSQQVAQKKKKKEDAEALIVEMREVSSQIKQLDEQIRTVEENLQQVMLSIPNITHDSVPIGTSEEDNVLHRTWGDTTTFSFEPKPHWELGTNLGILDFEAAAKVTGSRFVFYRGLGARLERALIQFMMDVHSEQHGYEEILPPLMVHRNSMVGTGQLPKFEEDAFKIQDTEYFMVPTAEVPVTNYYRDEILSMENLPQKFVAYSACFRSEAGSAGRDTRGIIRQHQFNKVELVHYALPEASYETLEQLLSHCEKILQLLKLPYRVMNLCTGDTGFSAAKTYDIEVWMPNSAVYREISSCSNFESFQARRANIRFRRDNQSKPEFLHTLNGSGLAIGRTVAAIMENYQQEDGSIVIPDVLQPYMQNVKKIIK
ncbi:serine--tRNA ligase [Longirhabdus pacifica]|uniref:serine--tRNA ligase n=1 Tax=Longirhabdus pacifica TaxID=2305227 RepID=UPI00100936B7|nr:serine--tRNA ligase [Longirhabdus pacifica]